MSEKKNSSAKNLSPDWFVRGILGKLGETFDRMTGRNRQPSNSLATSEIIEKLKNLLDSKIQDLGDKGKYVPHNLKLKMQWNKFSTDSENLLQILQDELLVAAIDHINDNLYHTFKPLNLQIKPDYFTEGVKILAGFDEFDPNDSEAELNITLPDTKVNTLLNEDKKSLKQSFFQIFARYSINNNPQEIKLTFFENKRILVGRTKENDLPIDDASVSKIHAALVLSGERQLLVADTGSTNGTFIDDERIAYGKSFPIESGAKVKFGTVEVTFEFIPKPTEVSALEDLTHNDAVEINGFEFHSKTENQPAPQTRIEERKTEVMILKPIEESEHQSEVLNTKQGIDLSFDEKSDSLK